MLSGVGFSPNRGGFEMKRLSSMFLKPPNGRLSILLPVFASLVPAFAHGGFDHIRGTVVKVANNVLTIKSTKRSLQIFSQNLTTFGQSQNCTRADFAEMLSEPPFGNSCLRHSVPEMSGRN